MQFIKTVWKFLVKAGLSTFTLLVMITGSISIFSLVQKGTIYYGDRCNSSLNSDAISYLNQEEIIAYDYELNCNTLYLDLSVNDSLNKEEIISLLVRISSHYKNISLNLQTQVTAKNSDYLVFASLINDGSVSLSVSEI